MKRFVLFIAVVLYTNLLLAQKKQYFNPSFQNRVNQKTSNKRIYDLGKNGEYLVKDYSKKSLVREGTFYGFNDLENLDKFIWYYSNGKFVRDGLNLNSNTATVTNYKDDGSLDNKLIFKNGEVFYCQVWNIDGQTILKNGNGKSEGYNSYMKEKTYKIYKDSILTKNYAIRDINSDTIYYSHQKSASPLKGLEAFSKDLKEAIEYPGLAKFLGAQGRVYVAFIVNEDGSLSDFEPLTNKGWKFEKRTVNALGQLPNWEPATFRNRTVKQRFVLPVTFKLN